MKRLKRGLVLTFLATAGGLAVAQELVALSDAQMDAVTAGAQYSIVYGTGYADAGTVLALANAGTISKANGSTRTKAELKVVAVGTGLVVLGGGESGAGGTLSGVYGEAVVDQGKLTLKVRTMSRINPNGKAMTKSKIKIKANGAGAQTYKLKY